MRRVRVNVGNRWYTVDMGDVHRNPVEVIVEGQRYLVEMEAALSGGAIMPSRATAAAVETKREAVGLRGITQGDERIIRCPMPGRIVAVSVKPGDKVALGDELCVLETMKMEQSVRSGHEGAVKEVHIKVGQNIKTGSPLLELT